MWRGFILLVVACAFIGQGAAAARLTGGEPMAAVPGAIATPGGMPCHEAAAVAPPADPAAGKAHPTSCKACAACHACCAAAMPAAVAALAPAAPLRYRLASAEAAVCVTFLTGGPLRPPRSTVV